MSRGIDIIIVHDGPERGAHVQHSQYELLKGGNSCHALHSIYRLYGFLVVLAVQPSA
jgi:hypothetical protein